MKRTVALAVLALAFAASNVRAYTDTPDPAVDMHVRQGLVIIVPSHDLCYGVEIEHGTRHIDTFGGPCE